jgi:glycosyltransferase involved in cell wall biosynthesis
MAPKVSLIMTVYNREQYLEAAIASVLAQTYPHYELILWDDGSTDRSSEIAARFAKQAPRIKLDLLQNALG